MKLILKIAGGLITLLILAAAGLMAADSSYSQQCLDSPPAGTVIRIPGETMTLLAVPSGDGEPLVVEVTREPYKPGYEISAAHGHLHPHQEERFELLEGRARFLVGEQTLEAGPGEVVVGPANTLHHWMALDGAPVRARVTFTPGDGVANFFQHFHAHLNAGPVDPMQAAVIAREYPRGTPLPVDPHPRVWDIALRVMAPIGRLLGYAAC